LPIALSPDFDALVDDGTDDVLIAITGTGNGIAIVDLTAVPDPDAKSVDRMRRVVGAGDRLRGSSNIGTRLGQQNPLHATQRRVVPHVTRNLLPNVHGGSIPRVGTKVGLPKN
jgi:hypothetical protein